MRKILVKNKLAWWLGGILIAYGIGNACLGTAFQKQVAINAYKESLQILANEKAEQVNIFLKSKAEEQNIIASMNVFKQAVLYPNDSAIIATAKDRINELKDTVSRIAIFTSEGIMFLAASGPVPVDYSTIPYFVSKDKNVVFMRYYDNFQKKDYYSIIGPIYDSLEKNKIIGAIALDVGLDKISALLKETHESATNEVYLIDETRLMLSGSEYIGQGNTNGVLIQEVESAGALACLADLKTFTLDGVIEEHEEEVLEYTNYMGNEVYGAHAYVPSIMGCVIAEEGEADFTQFTIIDYFANLFNNSAEE